MSDAKARRVAACTASPGERVIRGIVAIIVAAFAIALAPTALIIGIIAGVIAIGIGAMAITGFCPADWLRARTDDRTPENSLGYVDARAVTTLDTTLDKEQAP